MKAHMNSFFKIMRDLCTVVCIGIAMPTQTLQADNRNISLVYFNEQIYVFDSTIRISREKKNTKNIGIIKSNVPFVVRPGYKTVNNNLVVECFSWELQLPLIQLNNKMIETRLAKLIEEEKYLKKRCDNLYIALHPDSLFVIAEDLQSIWTGVNFINWKTGIIGNDYSHFIGYIHFNGHNVPVVTDKRNYVPWIKCDSTHMANIRISVCGDHDLDHWNVLLVKSMLRGREPIDSLTRNDMIHSWFDK